MTKLKRILSFLSRKERWYLVLIFICMVIVGLLELIGIGSISPFMSLVGDPAIINTNIYLNFVYNRFNFDSTQNFILFFGVVVIIFLTISNIARAGISFITRYYSGRCLHSLSLRFMRKYLYQPYVFFLNRNSSDLSKNILSEVSIFISGVLVILLQLLTNIIISLSIITVLVLIDPMVAFIVSSALGLMYLLVFQIVRSFLHRKGEERAIVNSLKYKYVSEAFSGIKDVKLLGRENVFIDQFAIPSKKYAMNNAISDVVSDAPKYLLETIAFASIIILILIKIINGSNVQDFLPVLTLYAFGGYRLLPALQKIFNAISKLKYNYPIVDILYKDYNNLPDRIIIENGSGQKPLSINNEIRLEDISFRYPNTNDDVIKKQRIVIKANTSVGFVGPTGCGKTTMIDIILGLLKVQEGKIFIDNIELTEKTNRDWQLNLGYVPQSIYLVDDTIKKNIAFGVPDSKIDIGAVKIAAKTANLHDFIENELEDKYESMVGERGVRLSGGQRQRIGIARAVYHNPSVLIMDEATSALDGLTEQAIMDAIHNLSHKKTIIMIAHRLTTVKECDVIHIMEKGRVIDSGKYEDLIKRNKVFRRMAEGN